eukprot:m.36594 g.36594  ORF g.36594 m.36594 type:complete len:51 (-) comp14512_c0_seq1:175-327(-)
MMDDDGGFGDFASVDFIGAASIDGPPEMTPEGGSCEYINNFMSFLLFKVI